MKGMKGRFLKKLKTIKPINSLKQIQDRVLQLNASNGLLLNPFNQTHDGGGGGGGGKCTRQEDQMNHHHCNPSVLELDMVDVSDEEMEYGGDTDENKENIGPGPSSIKTLKDPSMSLKENTENLILSSDLGSFFNHRKNPLSDLNGSSFRRLDSMSVKGNYSETPHIRQDQVSETKDSTFRRPDLNSNTLFDPNLLAAFEQAVMDYIRVIEAERKARIEVEKMEMKDKDDEEPPAKARRVVEEKNPNPNPLLEFEEKCPPGGNESVILYTTSLRGVRKTFEDCSKIQFLLGNFRVLYHERDVSMHLEFREQLWSILGGRVVPPRLFIRGRYIGGADEVIGLHEQGKLLQLLQGIPRKQSNNPCDGCGGYRFTMCSNCNGSRKVDGIDGLIIQCPQCNENGLIICTICC